MPEHSLAPPTARQNSRTAAFRFVLMIGVVSLFAGCAYADSRRIVGPYLARLGASDTTVESVVSGVLYHVSLSGSVGFPVVTLSAAIPFFLILTQQMAKQP